MTTKCGITLQFCFQLMSVAHQKVPNLLEFGLVDN